MNRQRKIGLLIKYITQQASLDELDELLDWIKYPENRKEFAKYAKINFFVDFNMKNFNTENSKKKLLKYIERERMPKIWEDSLRVIKYAAVILVLLGAGYFFQSEFSFFREVTIDNSNKIVKGNTIEMGSDKATLTLEDGSEINLESGKEIQTKSAKGNGKRLVYDALKENVEEVAYNFLTIPRGGQYQLELSDGTQVWLNSESRLKYPVTFIDGKSREVELVYGEAYFKVSPSILHSGAVFRVLNKSQEIEVLGTEFNIKAYLNETNIYTTLVEGSVEVSTNGVEEVLKPSQQLNLNLIDNTVSVNLVNINNETSWKRGLFSFKGKSLKEIAIVLERWYDVEIEFEKTEIENIKFNGVLNKNQTIDEIMNSILITKSINAYGIENRTIIIK